MALGDPIPNAFYPTAGQGLTLGANGKLPYGVADVVKIYDSTLVAAAASFAIALPTNATWADLEIIAYLRSDEAATQSTGTLQMNGDTGANYDYQGHQVNGATNAGFEAFAQTGMNTLPCPGGTAPAGVFGVAQVVIPNYAGTVGQKSAKFYTGSKGGVTTGLIREVSASAFWRSAAAITSMQITVGPGANFAAGSRVIVRAKL